MHLKNITLALMLLLALFSWSCRSSKQETTREIKEIGQLTDSVNRLEKRTTKAWVAPASSATLKLDIKQLADLPKGASFQNKQGNATASAKKADDGTLEITANCDSLTLLVDNLEIEVYRLQKENSALVAKINKKEVVELSSWQHFQVWCGRIALGLLIIFIAYKIIKRKWQKKD